MSIYGNSLNNSTIVEENTDVFFPINEEDYLSEAANKEKVSLVRKINGSIAKSLTKLGLKGSVKQHVVRYGVYGFTHDKKEDFKVDITLEDINGSVLKTIINNLPIPSVIKIILISIINGVSNTKTLSAIEIMTKAEDDIQKNLIKDIPNYKLKIRNIEKDKKYTNAVIMTIGLES